MTNDEKLEHILYQLAEGDSNDDEIEIRGQLLELAWSELNEEQKTKVLKEFTLP